MVAVEVEDNEIAGHDVVPLAEPPAPAREVRLVRRPVGNPKSKI
jgi:hypothetical protein